MTKKPLAIISVILLVGLMAACSSLKLPGASSNAAATQANQANPPDFADQQFESKLALGTLQLEGTANAVTAEQAATLLPLWKAMKSLDNSSTASPDEINALYAQIKETMTAGQVSAIEAMQVNPEDMTALMEQYGIQVQQISQGNRPTVSEDERATRIAQFQAQGGQTGQGGPGFFPGPDGGGGNFQGVVPPGGGGFEGGGFEGGGFNGGQNGQGAQPNAQGTPQPRAFRGGGFNNLFIDPLIKLLEEKTAAS